MGEQEKGWREVEERLIGRKILGASVHTFITQLHLDDGIELQIECEDGWMHVDLKEPYQENGDG